jgi:predicted nuclease with TOPRIM domain
MNQDEISEKLVEVEALSKSNQHRMDAMEKRQDNLEQLTSAFSVMQKEQEYIKEDVRQIKGDVKTLAEKPAKRWESIVERVITVVVGAVVGYLLSGGMFS